MERQRETALKKILGLGIAIIGGICYFAVSSIDEIICGRRKAYYQRNEIKFREYTDSQGLYHIEKIS